jgi:hypothetical protein
MPFQAAARRPSEKQKRRHFGQDEGGVGEAGDPGDAGETPDAGPAGTDPATAARSRSSSFSSGQRENAMYTRISDDPNGTSDKNPRAQWCPILWKSLQKTTTKKTARTSEMSDRTASAAIKSAGDTFIIS